MRSLHELGMPWAQISFIGTMLIINLSQTDYQLVTFPVVHKLPNLQSSTVVAHLILRNTVLQARWFLTITHSIPDLTFNNLVVHLILHTLHQVLCILSWMVSKRGQYRRWNNCCRNARDLTLILWQWSLTFLLLSTKLSFPQIWQTVDELNVSIPSPVRMLFDSFIKSCTSLVIGEQFFLTACVQRR